MKRCTDLVNTVSLINVKMFISGKDLPVRRRAERLSRLLTLNTTDLLVLSTECILLKISGLTVTAEIFLRQMDYALINEES